MIRKISSPNRAGDTSTGGIDSVGHETGSARDIQVAEAEVAKAKAGVVRAEADLAVTTIRAPIRGRVLKVHARSGERVGDLGIVEIGDTRAMHAVAEVYELDVANIRIGQKASVRVQSLPDALVGEVVHIGWEVGRRVVLDNDPSRIPMPVSSKCG